MLKARKNLILGIITVVILQLLTSCETTREIEYVSIITEEDIPYFPELNYYAESDDGEYVTVDAFWFQRVAEYKLKLDDVREFLRRVEELKKSEK